MTENGAKNGRAEQIESYGRAYETLTKALAQYPREMWEYKPHGEEWSIHEVVVHIADSEANSFIRCRRFIAQPGEPIMAYDEHGWAQALHYNSQSPEDALELFKWLRLTTYKLIKSLPDETWGNTVHHPENGAMSLEDWLHVYERHIPDHIEQMDRVYAEWKQNQRAV